MTNYHATYWIRLLAFCFVFLPFTISAADKNEVMHFNIPKQSVDNALQQFSSTTGIDVGYTAEMTDGLKSSTVNGELSANQALQELLSGTGLVGHFSDNNTVALKAAKKIPEPQSKPKVETISIKEPTDISTMETVNVVADLSGEKIKRAYKDTFTSVGVVTQEDIDNYHVNDLQDSFNHLANVRYFHNNQGNSGFQIRGLNADGVTQISNSAPLISVVIDGVTQSAEGLKRGARGTWDVKSIEVLRGPQSTLQGRNALAGTVIVETNDPTYEPELNAKASYDNQDGRDTAFAVSGPIVEDQLAVRLSGEFRDHAKNTRFTDRENKPLAKDEYRNIRGKILIEPEAVEGLRVLLSASDVYDNPTSVAALVSGPDFFDRKYITPSSSSETREMDVLNYAADISYALNEDLTLRSITAKNKTDLEIRSAPSATTFFRADNRKDNDFTQEFRLEMNNDYQLSGVAGLFYGNFQQKVKTNTLVFGFPFQVGTFKNETETKAIYADLRYKFDNNISLLAGARYQQDKVSNARDTIASPLLGGTNVTNKRETKENVFLPKYGIAYDIDDNQTIALTASKGYRQGFAEVVAGTTSDINEVDSEFMWAYEAAYRFVPDGKHFSLGANIFYNKYSDQQVVISYPAPPPFFLFDSSNTFNIADSISYGAEIEGKYQFANGINIFGSIGLLKTKFGNYEENCALSGGNCKGNEYPGAPSITASLGGIYKHHSGFFVAMDADYTSDYYTFGDINNQSDFELDSRIVANANVGYDFGDVKAKLFVENMFDKEYLLNASTRGGEATVGNGRVLGAEVLVRF